MRERVLTDPIDVLDPLTQHHQFSDLVSHGRKLDFDKILTGSEFFWQWVSTYADWINEMYQGGKPEALVGIARGANRLSTTMASSIGERVVGLTTNKLTSNTVGLDVISRLAVQAVRPRFILIVEDVGNTGGTATSVIPELRELGVERIESSQTWIRSERLKVLEDLGIPYDALIHAPLPTFSEEDCRTLPEGFCNQGVLLLPHGS